MGMVCNLQNPMGMGTGMGIDIELREWGWYKPFPANPASLPSLGTNKGNSKVAKKGANSDVVFSAHGSSAVASCSPKNIPLAERINNLERQMLNGKLILVDDDGKPLNKVDYALVNSDSESDVEVAYDETTQFMASGGANVANLYEDEDYDIYNTYDIEGLSKKDLVFCDMMDINHRGRDKI
ncbi:hypothetical protein Tco_0017287 [Tanacetum coccineum]